MPSLAVLQCVHCVVEHICKAPFATEATGTSHQLRSSHGGFEMKEHVRALQRTVFEFLVRCFNKGSELHGDELNSAVDVWVSWVTMGGTVRDNNADHHRRGNRIGAFTRQKSDRRELEPAERQWAEHNYVFFTVLPLRWVGAMARVARENPDMAVKIVEKVVFSLLDNLTIEYVDELSKLLQDERNTDPRRARLVQPHSRAYGAVPEIMEIVDMPLHRFIEMHCQHLSKSSKPTPSREDEYQSERRFRELMRSLRMILRDEDHESVTVGLRKLLHIDPESEQDSSGAQLTKWTIPKSDRGEWGFVCDENGIVTGADSNKLPIGGRIVNVEIGDRQPEPFKSIRDLRELLSEAGEARFEIQDVSSSLRMPLDADAIPWLSNGNWAPVFSAAHDTFEPPATDFAEQNDWCGIGHLLYSLNRIASEHPGRLMLTSVLMASVRICFGGLGVLIVGAASVLLLRSIWLGKSSHHDGHGLAVPRFSFEFSFLFKSAFSSPVLSLGFNIAWVAAFGRFFKEIEVSDTLSVLQLLGICA